MADKCEAIVNLVFVRLRLQSVMLWWLARTLMVSPEFIRDPIFRVGRWLTVKACCRAYVGNRRIL